MKVQQEYILVVVLVLYLLKKFIPLYFLFIWTEKNIGDPPLVKT